MREQVIAKRYARALFAIGQEAGDEELRTYGKELESLAEVVTGSPELIKIFMNPVIRIADKKEIVKNILQKLKAGKTVTNFCLFLADQGRLGNFLDIQQYYKKLLDIHEGILRGQVITAIELAKAKKDSIQQELENRFKQSLILEYEQDENILGGMVLKVGDRIYDASLRAQLNGLRENIKRGEI